MRAVYRNAPPGGRPGYPRRMGYDVTFHPVAAADLQRHFFDVIDDPGLARERAAIGRTPAGRKALLEGVLLRAPGLADQAAAGKGEFANTIAFGAAAVGADGIIVESHPAPEEALCDGPQQIPTAEFGDFAREVRLTEAEWLSAIAWLNRTGQISNEKREEFILASDVLGLSMLVVQMNHRLDPAATPASPAPCDSPGPRTSRSSWKCTTTCSPAGPYPDRPGRDPAPGPGQLPGACGQIRRLYSTT